ncbi:MAG: hypothetical protein ACJ780_13155 [Solirubrobacteraceae bacterium]
MRDQLMHIAIDVSIADEEIRGHVGDGVRAPQPFSGWLGLIGALDTMIGPPRQSSTAPDTREPRGGGSAVPA